MTDFSKADSLAPEPLISESLVGQEFDGRFEILSCVGKGATSAIYRARQISLDRIVALKILLPEAFSVRSLDRLKREAATITQLSHPGIVKVHSFNLTADGRNCYIVMDFIQGSTLQDYLRVQGKLDWPVAVEVVKQVAEALAHAHERGIIHRDLKPSNIMMVEIDGKTKPLVVDFGIAKLESAVAEAHRINQSGGAVGTPHYMSPEQCNGQGFSAQSDVYSLSCVLFELLSGVTPFKGDSAFSVMHKHVSELAPELPDSIPDWLRLAVSRGLAKNPVDRFAGMASMVKVLESADKHKPKQATGSRSRQILQILACFFGLLAVGALVRPLDPPHSHKDPEVSVHQMEVDTAQSEWWRLWRHYLPLAEKEFRDLSSVSGEMERSSLIGSLQRHLLASVRGAGAEGEEPDVERAERLAYRLLAIDRDESFAVKLETEKLFDHVNLIRKKLQAQQVSAADADFELQWQRLKQFRYWQKLDEKSRSLVSEVYNSLSEHFVTIGDFRRAQEIAKFWSRFETRSHPNILIYQIRAEYFLVLSQFSAGQIQAKVAAADCRRLLQALTIAIPADNNLGVIRNLIRVRLCQALSVTGDPAAAISGLRSLKGELQAKLVELAEEHLGDMAVAEAAQAKLNDKKTPDSVNFFAKENSAASEDKASLVTAIASIDCMIARIFIQQKDFKDAAAYAQMSLTPGANISEAERCERLLTLETSQVGMGNDSEILHLTNEIHQLCESSNLPEPLKWGYVAEANQYAAVYYRTHNRWAELKQFLRHNLADYKDRSIHSTSQGLAYTLLAECALREGDVKECAIWLDKADSFWKTEFTAPCTARAYTYITRLQCDVRSGHRQAAIKSAAEARAFVRGLPNVAVSGDKERKTLEKRIDQLLPAAWSS